MAQSAPVSEDVRQAQEVCLECHKVPTLWSTDPLTGREYRLGLDVLAWEKSSHAALRCEACHEYGYGSTVPHRSSRRRDAFHCVACHRDDEALADHEPDERRAAVKRSMHTEKLKDVVFDCHRCHDPHVFRLLEPNAAPTERIRWANNICLNCHGSEGGHRPFHEAPIADQTHGFLPRSDTHLKSTACVSCHGDAEQLWHRILPAKDGVSNCQACHARDTKLLHVLYGDGRSGPRTELSPDEDASTLIDNAEIFDDVYVIGATRAVGLERFSQAVFALLIFSIALHILARWLTKSRRRR